MSIVKTKTGKGLPLVVHFRTTRFREIEIKRKLSACRQAIKEKGAIDQIIMQGILFGLPLSGLKNVDQEATYTGRKFGFHTCRKSVG